MAEMPDVIGGETIDSDWGNDIRDRTIQRYATAAVRTAEIPTPTAGDLSYLNDTGLVYVFSGGAWKSPVASSKLGYAQTTSSQSMGSSVTDLSGLSVTVTVGSARSIRISGSVRLIQRTNPATLARCHIREGSTVLFTHASVLAVSDGDTFTPQVILNSESPGSHTYKLSSQTDAGTIDTGTSSAFIAWILVEDIGPV